MNSIGYRIVLLLLLDSYESSGDSVLTRDDKVFLKDRAHLQLAVNVWL